MNAWSTNFQRPTAMRNQALADSFELESKYPPAKPGALTIAGPSKGPFRHRKSRARHPTLDVSTSPFQVRIAPSVR